ncbi:L-type lectin-domain containing receptor kinase -like, partial [Olea europaea subsp. europaea]
MEYMYVGFSTSTGSLASSHHIAGWTAVSVALLIGIILYMIKKIKSMDVIEPWKLDIGLRSYRYEELKKATGGFKDRALIGYSGFGIVHKGTLPNTNTKVAVKQINSGSKQGLGEFISGIASIGRLRHRNLFPLLGWC